MTEWQPMSTEPNDGSYRLYGLHVTAGEHSWFEIHYVCFDDSGQILLPSGDNFDDWAFDDFEVWADAPKQGPTKLIVIHGENEDRK